MDCQPVFSEFTNGKETVVVCVFGTVKYDGQGLRAFIQNFTITNCDGVWKIVCDSLRLRSPWWSSFWIFWFHVISSICLVSSFLSLTIIVFTVSQNFKFYLWFPHIHRSICLKKTLNSQTRLKTILKLPYSFTLL